MEFKVFPSKLEESKEGWVWIPPGLKIETNFVEIKNPENKKKIVCEKRVLDDNYIKNHEGLRGEAKWKDECIVINEFYRNILQIKNIGRPGKG